MRIVHFTAGAADMYCGSCFRDNALAAALKSQGHDILLQPIYTPTLTDEPNVSGEKVLFGGVSIYLQQQVPFFRVTPRWLDSIWDSPAALKLASKRSITTSPKLLGELTVSMLRGEDGVLRKEFRKLTYWLQEHQRPEIVNISYSLLIALARAIKGAWDVPVCCTLQGDDLFLEGLEEPYRSTALEFIRDGARWVDQFIAVSDYCAGYMSDYLAIPRSRIAVVPIGINTDGFDRRPPAGSQPFRIGYFARVAPEKGLHHLCAAYRKLREMAAPGPSRLEVAGYLKAEHRDYLDAIRRDMAEAGLADQFHYHGALDRDGKIAFLRSLDVLSVPSPYAEPKGLFVLEAMACGVPVVQPRHGAYPELIARTGGGITVEPNDAVSLAEGLLTVWKDAGLRLALADRAYEGVRRHYTARHMAIRLAEVYEGLRARHQQAILPRRVSGQPLP